MTDLALRSYKIDLPEFSGPLDLLLNLIEQNDLDITVISLATVTEQYLSFAKEITENRVEFLIDFLVIAAKLLVIKSRALLPFQTFNENESLDEDPGVSLARQLRRYRRFKDSAEWLAQRQEAGYRTHVRVVSHPLPKSQLNLDGVDLASLLGALLAVLTRSERLENSLRVAVNKSRHTIDGQIRLLRANLLNKQRVYFHELLSKQISWIEVSVTLLAVLELIKQHEVHVVQPELFGPIQILRTSSQSKPAH